MPSSLLERVNELGMVDALTELAATVLNHVKSNRIPVSGLRRRAASVEDAERARAFVDIFEPLYRRYEDHLREEQTIDFDDMIVRATDHVRDGAADVPLAAHHRGRVPGYCPWPGTVFQGTPGCPRARRVAGNPGL